MGAQVSPLGAVPESHRRFRCWLEAVILALGVPAAIWCVSNLIKLSIPAALHGSPEQRYMLWIAGGAIVEWLFVIGVAWALRVRGLSFKDYGIWRVGTWPAWAVALLFAGLSISSNLRFFPRMHIPISYAFFPPGFHLAAALIMGVTAG